jgi:FtsP/CotA-like multicopper oxidase with cupredoxin domain
MKRKLFLLFTASASLVYVKAQNTLAIPPTLQGPNINLTLQEGTTDFYSGVTTNTMGANGSLLGPTLILNNGDALNITVDNQLTDTTTIHWHGLHVAPENDGGPHSIIYPGDTWNPQFTIMDKAGTYWYHPHLHMQTDKHVSKGIAGMILVRDTEEAALGLPMTYGVDEFPIVMQTKGFDVNGQIVIHTELDTSVMINGTVDPVVDMPAQVVRLRVLNGSSQRLYEVGFSDNRQFSLIGTDGGLLSAPVGMTRYRMAPGQRADILVDLSADMGTNIQLMNYGSELPNAVYGAAQPGMGAGATASLVGYTDNPLNGADFQLLDISVVAQTTSPVSVIPSTLATLTPLLEGAENITRDLTFTSATMGDLSGPFFINGSTFDMGTINYTVPLDNIEIWTLTNGTPIAHPFHIHDVQFYILDINGAAPPAELQGLNDVVLVPGGNGVVRFIAQFSDFASDTVPFMYHCHMLTHEDMGMMGQFLVVDGTGVDEIISNEVLFNVYPNPSVTGSFTIDLSEMKGIPEFYEIFSIEGKLIEKKMISQSKFEISIQNTKGMYLMNIHSNSTVSTQMLLVD